MNNKGFAITGIIYTLFILFLMISLSILSGLRATQRLMINSTEGFEERFKGIPIEVAPTQTYTDAPYSGKYIFEVTTTKKDNTKSFKCYTYLKKGTKLTDISKIKFTTKDCNDYEYIEEPNTEEPNTEGPNTIKLIEIYNFEEGD